MTTLQLSAKAVCDHVGAKTKRLYTREYAGVVKGVIKRRLEPVGFECQACGVWVKGDPPK